MRILLDLQGCQTTGSRNRGIGRYSMALARGMVREGAAHEFHLLLNGSFAETIAPIQAEFSGLLPADRMHVFHVPHGCADNSTPPRWRTLAAPAMRRCAIDQVQPDLVHVSSLFEGLGDDCTSEIDAHGVPTAVTLYDFIPYLYADRYLEGKEQRAWYMRRLDAMRRAALLLGISASACSEAETVLADRRGRVVNMSSAANPALFHEAPPADSAQRFGLTRPFVMYTGGIDWRKNIEGLIEAFSALPRELRGRHQLAIVCHAEEPARLRLLSLARARGLAPDDVVMTGFVADEDLADLYRSCELFVFPSLHEGFGLPALEAMMCGAPVIGSNTSSIPEVVGRADALFDPRSRADITSHMRRALEDRDFHASLKAHAREHAKRISWEQTARTAIAAMEEAHARRVAPAAARAKPRLAMLAPLPPVESGIADYTCELLPVLAQHYDIELVHSQPEVRLPPALAHLPVHGVEWFREHAREFERVVYQFGNSSFHAHMFTLLREIRGVVVLHDFFLGGALNWMEAMGNVPDAFRNALLRSHGRAALEADRAEGREVTMYRYPANRFVLERASGVIVHSNYSIAAAAQWYGPDYARRWARIPHLRVLPAHVDRERARRELGLGPGDFLVCSFGHIGATKLNHRLLQAWLASSVSRDARCKLVLVGKNTIPPYGDEVLRLVDAANGQVSITGYAPRETYERYLFAADAAVQLRTMSRGETSGAVLDCLGHGVPLIANANGSNAEYPQDVLRLLPDEFSDGELVAALEQFKNDAALRARLSAAARAHVATLHDPATIARQYRDAIEAFAARPQHRGYWDAVAAIGALGPTSDADLADAAIALEATWVR